MRRSGISDRAREPSGSEIAGYIPFSEDNGFRASMLSEALKCLPAVIFVNESGNGYYIRDRNGRVAWADDLPKGGGAVLIEYLFSLYLQENRSLPTGKPQTNRKIFAEIRDKLELRENFTFYYSELINGHFITIVIQFGSDGNYEIQIEQTHGS